MPLQIPTLRALPLVTLGLAALVADRSHAMQPIRLPARHNAVADLAFSPSGDLLAVVHQRGNVVLWNLAQRRSLDLAKLEEFSDAGHDFVRYSSDGRRLTAGNAFTVRCWDLENVLPLQSLLSDVVTNNGFNPLYYGDQSLCASRDGATVVMPHARKDKLFNCRILDSVTGDIRCEVPYEGPVRQIILAGNASRLAVVSAAETPTVDIFDAQTGTLIAKLSGFADELKRVAVSHDGQFIACVESEQLWVWKFDEQARTYLPISRTSTENRLDWVAFDPHDRYVYCNAPYAAGQILRLHDLAFQELDSWGYERAFASGTGTMGLLREVNSSPRVELFNSEQFLEIHRFNPRTPSTPHQLALSADARRVAVADRNGHICVWDTTQRPVTVQRQGRSVRLATRSHPKNPTQQVNDPDQYLHAGRVRQLQLDAAGKLLAGITYGSGDSQHDIECFTWSLEKNSPLVYVRAQLDFSPDNQAISTRDNVAVFYSPHGSALASFASGRVTVSRTTSGPDIPRVAFVAFSPDGTLGATGFHSGDVTIYDTRTNRKTAELRPLPNEAGYGHVRSIAIAPNNRLVAVSYHGNAGTLVWNLDRPQVVPPPITKDRPSFVSFLENDAVVTVSSDRRQALIWDGRTGQQRQVIPLDSEHRSVRSVAFTRDGLHFATANDGGDLCICRTATQEVTHRFLHHNHSVNAIALSDDGGVLVSGDDAGYLAVWQVEYEEQRVTSDTPLRANQSLRLPDLQASSN